MERIIIVTCLMLFMASCSGDADKKSLAPIENLERPVDWSASVTIDIYADTSSFWPKWAVAQHSIDEDSFEELLSQLWKLAFSGDAEVYAVDALGAMDESNALNPTELVDQLSTSDTIWVENLETGELAETVVDFEFSESTTSAIVMNGNIVKSNDGTFIFHASEVGIGERIFDNEGAYRGVKARYYIDMQSPEYLMESHSIKMGVESDSTGLFRIQNFFGVDENAVSLTDFIGETKNSSAIMDVSMELKLDYRNRQLFAIITSKKSA